MQRFLDWLGGLIVHGSVTLLYVLLVASEFALLAYVGYASVFAPMAAAPGSRDGAGLIFVGLIILVGVFIGWAMLVSITTSILKAVFPWWTPPESDEFEE